MGRIPPLIYPEGVAPGADTAVCNPFGVDAGGGIALSQGALTRPWAVLCNAFGVKNRGFSTEHVSSCFRGKCGGTASAAGSRFAERVLSVVATCRQQSRNVLEYLRSCCEAQLHGQAAPSLLPQADANYRVPA